METIRLKAAAASNPKSMAGAISNNLREGKAVEIVAMGAQAVNNTMKAIAISGEFAAADGNEILCRPVFTHLVLEGEKKSAMVMIIESRRKA